MSAAEGTPVAGSGAGWYRIRIRGRLAPRWSAWFDGAALIHDEPGTTLLHAHVEDQATLYGLIQRVGDLGLPLMSVTRGRRPDGDGSFPARPLRGRVAVVTTFSGSEDLRGAEFHDVDLRGARFVRTDLSGAVMRGVDVQDVDLDAPWLGEDGASLRVNGVDVAPLVDAELNRRFPGRADRRADNPADLRTAWSQVERTWTATLDRVAAMPPGTVDRSVGGEWSFAQTLRHLVMATDTWLGRAIRELEQPYHPLGQPNAEYATDGYDTSVFTTRSPSYAEVLEAREDRVAMVREYLATVASGELAEPRAHPWGPDHRVTVLHCLHVILNEEWEHHRFAVRDLDALAAESVKGSPDEHAGA